MIDNTPNDAAGELRQQLNDIWIEIGSELSERFNSGQGNFDFEPFTNKVLSLFAAQQRRLVEDIEGELPAKYTLATGLLWDSQDATDGFHQAVDQVRTIIARKKKEIS